LPPPLEITSVEESSATSSSSAADVKAAAQLRHHPDGLLAACRRHDGEAAERSTRDALLWVLEQLKTMLDDAERGSEAMAAS
jgi:DNA-binding GntR family transcriptional regulator